MCPKNNLTKEKKYAYGNLIIRIGLAVLFIYAGLEKFFTGFLGSGSGLKSTSEFICEIGFASFGQNFCFAMAIIIATVELVSGILILINKNLFLAYSSLAFLLFMIFVMVHIPGGNLVDILTYFCIFMTLLGLAIQSQRV